MGLHLLIGQELFALRAKSQGAEAEIGFRDVIGLHLLIGQELFALRAKSHGAEAEIGFRAVIGLHLLIGQELFALRAKSQGAAAEIGFRAVIGLHLPIITYYEPTFKYCMKKTKNGYIMELSTKVSRTQLQETSGLQINMPENS